MRGDDLLRERIGQKPRRGIGMNAEEAAVSCFADERTKVIDRVRGEAGPVSEAAADAEHPVNLDAHAHAVHLDVKRTFLPPQRHRARRRGCAAREHVAGSILARKDSRLAVVKTPREEPRFPAQMHRSFDIGGKHRGMVLPDEKAVERNRLLHRAGKVSCFAVQIAAVVFVGCCEEQTVKA
ncbi:hypothetical protein [Bradyrhizobium sp. LHD-71]|uniref:hypothetical protein n=1 Tax=Bradyrhizobium sp. LHD-71 TaxID=3072141 RepID=UPI00280E213E|nr:hypothetical protein [Bradyrhizobium sp. LHD-71]MDQ8727383.1 hypothetical protein [Bradyrhizobium sp. LHD-71]